MELVGSWEQAEGTEWLSGKPVHARVERTHRITDQSQVERTVTEMVAFAESVDWRVSEPVVASQALQGSKQLPPGPGRLWISFGEGDDADPDGPSMLRITLDFGPVRVPDTTTSTTGGSKRCNLLIDTWWGHC